MRASHRLRSERAPRRSSMPVSRALATISSSVPRGAAACASVAGSQRRVAPTLSGRQNEQRAWVFRQCATPHLQPSVRSQEFKWRLYMSGDVDDTNTILHQLRDNRSMECIRQHHAAGSSKERSRAELRAPHDSGDSSLIVTLSRDQASHAARVQVVERVSERYRVFPRNCVHGADQPTERNGHL